MDLFQIFFALVFATIGVSQVSALASNATKAKDSAISIFSILDRKSKINTSSNEGMILENVTGDIDFSNVSFKYPSRPDVHIFSDFTLHIPSRKVWFLIFCNLFIIVASIVLIRITNFRCHLLA